jgi:hypothetical protein
MEETNSWQLGKKIFNEGYIIPLLPASHYTAQY